MVAAWLWRSGLRSYRNLLSVEGKYLGSLLVLTLTFDFCSAFTGQDRGCGRLLRCCIIIPCLRSLKRRDTWPDIHRIAQLSSSTVTLTPLCGQCRTQLSHITAHCRENILTLHHLHWIWKHAKDPTQSLAWLNIHWSCCKTGYDDTYSLVIVEFCSHVSFTDMMTDDRTELNVLTLYHYSWQWSLSADRCAEHRCHCAGVARLPARWPLKCSAVCIVTTLRLLRRAVPRYYAAPARHTALHPAASTTHMAGAAATSGHQYSLLLTSHISTVKELIFSSRSNIISCPGHNVTVLVLARPVGLVPQ